MKLSNYRTLWPGAYADSSEDQNSPKFYIIVDIKSRVTNLYHPPASSAGYFFMSSGRGGLDPARLEAVQRTIDRLLKEQQKAFKDGNGNAASDCARKIAELMGMLHKEKRRSIIVRIKAKRAKVLTEIAKHRHVWEREILPLMTCVRRQIETPQGKGLSGVGNSIASSIGSLMSGFAGESPSKQRKFEEILQSSLLEKVKYGIKKIPEWSDILEEHVIAFDSIDLADLGDWDREENKDLEAYVKQIREERKRAIKEIQKKAGKLDEALKLFKAIHTLHTHLLSLDAETPDKKCNHSPHRPHQPLPQAPSHPQSRSPHSPRWGPNIGQGEHAARKRRWQSPRP
ncbi:hypothetical protein AAMO2058_000345100 [Amorphochlora amoebiformis]